MHDVVAKGILSSSNGMNIYRGCTHGCIYCDARSHCYGMDHIFEDIEVKANVLQLLEDALKKKRKKCMIGTGAMSDPYIHLEENLQNTRKCLEIIDKYGFGLAIQTKSNRILRDLDLLRSINKKAKCVVQMTLTTYDEELCKIIEPNVSTTKERFEVLKIMRDNKIPTVVWLSPILPYINDTEKNIRGILDYCIEAKVKGIIVFGIGLTLRNGNREYYYKNLDKHFKGLKEKYIREYGNSYEVLSKNHEKLMKIIKDTCQQNNIIFGVKEVFNYMKAFEEENNEVQIGFDI
ncbi:MULTISPECIES: SPL family radical SAM protein [Clostridium]|jgi:DNA repair photolyase|uniref:Radical SAM protein n=3 Tax=Clostridium TaxID=1485 RepID=A0AAV3W2J0_9CLOT|nr:MULTISPECIES: radical SAM protein [Clostridium]ABR35632.1 Radical SAM domain protein [Clostridium beijerinckii NCIMB 8052]AIU03489.1 radical SAM domain-containing protein [Clostridium beijerinckii ATCC 35702]MBF7809729.1 radical SAM protein [Clostridium beijerinckii]NRT69492.1 DNA repair photolyase [Clostridium beijerinckii]NRT84360.1 DNA repair photolyase [Clostridium beijerinckii]